MRNKSIFYVSSLFLFLCSILASSYTIAATKPSIVYVYSDSCRMCTVFENKVLADPEVRKALGRFNYKKVNASTSSYMNVDVTPTVIVYDKNNKEKFKFIPPLEKTEFLNILKKI